MKLGSFYGLTAPMAVTVLGHADIILRYVRVLQYCNKDVLDSFCAELSMLLHAVNNLEYKVDVEEKVLGSSLRIRNGELVDVGGNQEELRKQLEFEFTARVVKELLALEQAGLFFQHTESDTIVELEDIVKQYLKTAKFNAQNADREVRKLCLRLVDYDGNSIFDDVLDRYSICQSFSNDIGEDERKVLMYFFSKKEEIQKVFESIANKNYNTEDFVFGKPFTTLIRRRAESIYVCVTNMFEFLKSKQSAIFLDSVVQECRVSIEVLRRCIERDCTKTKNVTEMMNKSKYTEVSKNFNLTKDAFFTKLMNAGKLELEGLTEEDFRLLSDLYDLVFNSGADFLNQHFGINRDWEEFSKQLFNVGIYGMNIYSKELFGESIGNLVLVTNQQILKSEEELEMFQEVIRDVEALLNTLQPIGGVIE